jgi:hypothetical protein
VSATFSSFTYDTGGYAMRIGESGQTGIDGFSGIIDEVRLSKIARTSFTTHPTFESRYPNITNGTIYQLGGNVRGLGVIASTGAGGLQSIYLKRTTTVPATESIKPKPITLLQVLDPQGKVAAVWDCTDAPTGTSEMTLSIPDAGAGLYTISVCGGRNGDQIQIGLPSAAVHWGTRGEMALGFSNLPAYQDYYLYLPRTYSTCRLFVFGTTALTVNIYQSTNPIAFTSIAGASTQDAWNSNLNRYELTINTSQAPASTSTQPSVLKIRMPTGFNNAIAFDGVPGLLCSTEAAAIALAGGTSEANGLLVAGPLQKRARDWAWAQHQVSSDYTVTLDFPTTVPPTQPNALRESLPFSKYGPLNGLQAGISDQKLDVNNAYFGTNLPASDTRGSWEAFQYGGVLSPFDTAALASACTVPSATVSGKKLNPAENNANLIRRATLYAFYHLASLQGDQLIREGSMAASNYPTTHSFFVYYGLAEAYHLLKASLDPTAKEIWKDGLLAIGDKSADLMGYQSNQWGHVMLGHLYVYLSTNERRFLKWFEQQMEVYVDGGYGANNKFGQHPAGYFLEEYGPDGNYDSMNLYILTRAYYLYKSHPLANSTLVGKMQQAIEKNLAFKAYHWLPQPNGKVFGPTGMNCRVLNSTFANALGYPGISIAQFDFPMARKRQSMTQLPASGVGDAGTFSHIANTDAWGVRLINWGLPLRDAAFTDLKNPNGAWLASLHDAYLLPQTAAIGTLPCESATDQTWGLPGQFAWKRGALYGTTLFSVEGGQTSLIGKFGGGPTCIWAPETGVIIASMQNQQSFGAVSSPSHLTHSSVYWMNGSTVFWTGDVNTATGAWITANQIYETTETTSADGTARTIKWRYDLTTPASPKIVINASPMPTGLKINLPILVEPAAGAVLDISIPGQFTYTSGGKTFKITWPSGSATLESSDLTNIQRLVIPVSSTNFTLTLSYL